LRYHTGHPIVSREGPRSIPTEKHDKINIIHRSTRTNPRYYLIHTFMTAPQDRQKTTDNDNLMGHHRIKQRSTDNTIIEKNNTDSTNRNVQVA
jgi:hypothetical protein